MIKKDYYSNPAIVNAIMNRIIYLLYFSHILLIQYKGVILVMFVDGGTNG